MVVALNEIKSELVRNTEAVREVKEGMDNNEQEAGQELPGKQGQSAAQTGIPLNVPNINDSVNKVGSGPSQSSGKSAGDWISTVAKIGAQFLPIGKIAKIGIALLPG